MIPEFPMSREMTLADKPLFDAIFAANPPELSAYTFTNIFAWRGACDATISRLGGHVLVLCDLGDTTACIEPFPLEESERSSYAEVAEEMLRRSPRPLIFQRLSAGVASTLESAGLVVEPDRDNWDYLYSSKDLITLAGRKYDGKRNQIVRAKSKIDYEYLRIDASLAAECEEFAHRWCVERNCETVQGLQRERCAIHEMLTNLDDLGIVGGAIRGNGEIVAFSLGEALNPETFVVHIEKADTRIDGLYQLINNEFCIAECRGEAFARESDESQQANPQMLRPYKYVNREQDLGLPGLRKAKISYHPVRMIESFIAHQA